MSIKYNIKTAGPNLTSGEIQEIPFAKLTPTAVEYTENGEYTVNPPTGYDGLSTVSVTVDVPSPTLGTTTVDPTTSQQVITAASGTGFDTITVNAVTAAIDSNITAGNIKKDVEILGVTGTYAPSLGTLSATANATYSASAAGLDGFDTVTVNVQPNLTSVTAGYTANGNYTINVPTGYDGMTAVEVEVNVSGSQWESEIRAYNKMFSRYTGTGAELTGFVGSTLATSDSDMFNTCANITTVPNFHTESVTDMSQMFQYCSSLTTIPAFDTSKVTFMSYMFMGCVPVSTKLNTIIIAIPIII